MSESTIDLIKKTIEGNKVAIFMKGTPDMPRCGFSAASVEILKAFGYPFTAVDILANPEIRSTLPEYSNWPTFPQIFVAGQLIGGCDILHELRDTGELKKILETAHKTA